MERQHGQKSHPANPETPLQSRSGISCDIAFFSGFPAENAKIQVSTSQIVSLNKLYTCTTCTNHVNRLLRQIKL